MLASRPSMQCGAGREFPQMKILVASAALALSCVLCSPATAITVTIASQDTSDFTTLPADNVQTAPSFMTGTVHVNQTGSVANQWRSPFENANPGSGASPNLTNGGWYLPGAYDLNYITIQAGGTATYDFSSSGPLNTLSMLWGSPDSYNSILFCTGISGGVGSGCSSPVTGDNPPISIQTYGHNQITFTTDDRFLAIILGSTINAFEYANFVASCSGPECRDDIAPPVPLPPAMALFATGLAALGLLARRRKKQAA